MCAFIFLLLVFLLCTAAGRRLDITGKRSKGNTPTAQGLQESSATAQRIVRPHNGTQWQGYGFLGKSNELHWLIVLFQGFNLPATAVPHFLVQGAGDACLQEPARCSRVRMQIQDAFEAFMNTVKSIRKENVLDSAQVVEILKADIPQILRQEPNWDVYAEEFQVIDRTGAKQQALLQGLGATKMLTYLFRGIRNKVIVKDDIQVSVINSPRVDEPLKPSIVVRWQVRLERPPPYEKWREEYAVNFEIDTLFHFNDRNRVDYARIDKTLLNGREFEMWPEVTLSANPAMFLMGLREWVIKLVKEMPEMEPFTNVQEWAQNVKTVDVSASPVIKMWKSIAAMAKTNASSDDDNVGQSKVVKKMDGAQSILTQMADDIECATVDEILALVFNADESEADLLVNIYAMATASQNSIFDDSGRLEDIAENLGLKDIAADLYTGGRVPVLEIGEVVAMPTSQMMGPFMGGLGKELLLRIVRRAAALGRLVTIVPANDSLQQYYEKIGFEKIDSFGRSMVYSKPLPQITDKERTFEMESLRVQ